MKKIILCVAFCCTIFQLSHGMDGAFASFKDALIGNKRDLQKEIDSAKTDTSLTPAARAKQVGKLYGELRNKYRGKEEYTEYNQLMCRYNEIAKEQEAQEQEVARLMAEQDKRDLEEKNLKARLETITSDESLSTSLAKCDARIECYHQLKMLFDGINKEKYNLYDASQSNFEQKKSLLLLKATLETTPNKSKQAEILREMSTLCKKTTRAKRYITQSETLEAQVQKEEKQQKYHETFELISQTTDLSQRAKLYRVLMYYCEEKKAENLEIAKQLEARALEEQRKQDITINKIAHLASLRVEIDASKKEVHLNPRSFAHIDKLMSLLDKCLTYARDLPNFESIRAEDSEQLGKLRRQALALAPNEATRQAIQRSLQQP